MFGWRGKLGVMVTSSDPTTEAEYNRYLPQGVSLHASRMLLEDGQVTPETLEEMADDAERCARLLNTLNVDVIAYACTTGSLIKGHGYEDEIERRIADTAETPAVATAASIQRAFDALNVESVAVATPYTEALDERERVFLEEAGYEVSTIEGLGFGTDREIGRQSPEVAYRQAQAVDCSAADAVFISCTGTRTFEIITQLERDLGKPVVTSNQATLWDALRTMGIEYSSVGLGTLFDH
ncbi:maleate cis-trans isomerase family protein [Halorussus salinisoli]|uniref:maleate cis-trans isomerase family protein n=1 Tax=Halorussus salinisoli TaxID=2558242 RepID=UPI0010C1A20D|nr:aspartate/glutamate racemase family protein [Halorussus salinisoli]